MCSAPLVGKGHFGAALAAAQQAAGAQHYPAGALYVVATPIGNLADISLRALHVLHLADAIACEDTRHTQPLLAAYGIAARALLAVHEHNEAGAAAGVLARLAAGERVAYVSDAGTPAVSDPGARLAAACAGAGHRVVPLPGASSVTCAISAAGLAGDGRFVFAGFLPARRAEQAEACARLAAEPRAVVLLEAPHRIAPLAASLAALGPRRITVARELTKQFEQITTLPCADLPAWLAAEPQRARGEFALVLHPAPDVPDAAAAQAHGAEAARVLRLLLAELPVKTAVRLAADITGGARNALYAEALRQRGAGGGETEGEGQRVDDGDGAPRIRK